MPTVIREGRVAYTFDDRWVAVAWDGPDGPYRAEGGIEKLKGTVDGRSESTKAVDIIARQGTAPLCLIEVKDLSRDDQAIVSLQERALEIALKVRDTLAALQGVGQRDDPRGMAEGLGLGAGAVRVRVVALVHMDQRVAQHLQQHARAYRQTLQHALRKRLQWLTRRPEEVVVFDPLSATQTPSCLEGMGATAIVR